MCADAPHSRHPRREPAAEKKGKGSETAQKANAKAAKEGKSNPRKSSAPQTELGQEGRQGGSEEELIRDNSPAR